MRSALIWALVVCAGCALTEEERTPESYEVASTDSGYYVPAVTQPAGPFQATFDAGLAQPEVVIQNDTPYTITVRLTGPAERSLVVGPGQSATDVVMAGSYSYTASADEVQPDVGTADFAANYRYTWRFFIQND